MHRPPVTQTVARVGYSRGSTGLDTGVSFALILITSFTPVDCTILVVKQSDLTALLWALQALGLSYAPETGKVEDANKRIN